MPASGQQATRLVRMLTACSNAAQDSNAVRQRFADHSGNLSQVAHPVLGMNRAISSYGISKSFSRVSNCPEASMRTLLKGRQCFAQAILLIRCLFWRSQSITSAPCAGILRFLRFQAAGMTGKYLIPFRCTLKGLACPHSLPYGSTR